MTLDHQSQNLPNTPLYSTPPGSSQSPDSNQKNNFKSISNIKKRRYSQGPKFPTVPSFPNPGYALDSFELDQKRLKTEQNKNQPDSFTEMKMKKDNPNQSSWSVQVHQQSSSTKYPAPNIIPDKKKKVQFTSDGQITGSTSTSGADSELNFAESPHITLQPRRYSSKILNGKRLRLNLRKNINKSFDFQPATPDKSYQKVNIIDTKETRAKLMKLQKKYRKTQEKYLKSNSQKKSKKK